MQVNRGQRNFFFFFFFFFACHFLKPPKLVWGVPKMEISIKKNKNKNKKHMIKHFTLGKNRKK